MKRSPGALPHLFEHWPRIAARIRSRGRVAVFLDFDGTLVPIAPKPDRVRVKAATRRALQQLARDKRASVTVISGRRRAELKRYVAIPRLRHLGLYGWERDGKEHLPPSARIALFRAHVLLLKELAPYPAVWIEPKHSSFSVHLLNAEHRFHKPARAAVRKFLLRFRDSLELRENLRDLEVMPRHLPNKGGAVRESLSRNGTRGALTFFFGDDLSDEPAFAALRGGISVLVGKQRQTHARFRLKDPDEVTVALKRLKEALQ